MPRAAHPGRGSATILPGALAASRRPATLSLTDVIDVLGTDLVQTEDPDTGAVTSTFPVVTADVPARIEPSGRSDRTVVIGGDEAAIDRWTIEIPHSTALARDQHVDVTTSTNPQLQGARLRVVADLDSSTEPLRRVSAVLVDRGEG